MVNHEIKNVRKPGKIRMQGAAEREVPYDVMEVEIRFEARERTSEKATEAVNKQCEKFLRNMKKCGVDIRNFKVGNNATNQYSYGAVPSWLKDDLEKKKIDVDLSKNEPYAQATKNLSIKLPFDMKLRDLVDQIVVKEGLNADVDTNYLVSNENEIRQELIRSAIANSKAMAELLASSAGQKIVGVKEIVKDDICIKAQECCCESGAILGCMPMLLDEVSAETTTLSESVEIVWLIE